MNVKKGIVVFTINCGMLPPMKAEAFISRVKDHLKGTEERDSLDDWHLLFLPVRPPVPSRVEVFAQTSKGLDKIRPHVLRVRESLRVAELEAKLADCEERLARSEAEREKMMEAANA